MSEHGLKFICLDNHLQLQELDNLQAGEYTNFFDKYPHFSTVVFVPTNTMNVLQLKLPHLKNVSSNHLEPLLYAAENALSEDIEELDLILLNVDKSIGVYTVAVFRKSLLKQWFEKLEEANVLPAVVLPDFYLLPYEVESSWSIFCEGDKILVRTSLHTGFCTEQQNVEIYLSSVLNASELTDIPDVVPPSEVKYLCFYNANKIDNTLELSHPSLKIIEHKNNLTLWELAKQKHQWLPDINLLEHHPENVHFSRTRKLKQWIWPTALLALWLVTLVVTGLSEYVYLSVQHKKIDQKISELYFQLYPNAAEVVSPKERMLQDLKFAKINKEKFWAGLINLDAALDAEPKATLQSIRYENNQFQLMIVSQSGVDVLERLNTGFKNKGLQVSAVNIVSAGQEVSETLILGVK
jgi:type II secretion system protein L